MKNIIYSILGLLFCSNVIVAQENTAPLGFNDAILKYQPTKANKQTRGINLPFIDDFSNVGPYPDASKWLDKTVYVNNSFGVDMPTSGVATFDILDQNGHVYNPSGVPFTFYADSLTSVTINMGGLQASDSVYLSFFYQPQGRGFKPETADSLSLFFLGNNNTWVKVWSKEGTGVLPFQHVLIPITSSFYFHNNFQFRFINKASPNTNDDNWNLDYVRLDKNRNKFDTLLNEVAFTQSPSLILENYTGMPYRHFVGNESTEQTATYIAPIANLSNVNRNINIFAQARETNSNSILKNDTLNITLNGGNKLNALFNKYNFTLPLVNAGNTVRHRYYFPAQGGNDIRNNDTAYVVNYFDNYFSYDDGTAEKSYYLLAASNVAARTAIQFKMNVADSVQGLAIRWGSQSPTAEGKTFGIYLYQKLADSFTTDQIIYKQDFYTVQYPQGQDQFAYYKFDTTQFLPAGEYYIGTNQPINSGSDTLYFGMDVNTNVNKTKFYYLTQQYWETSDVDGTVMFRPLVGAATWSPVNISNTAVEEAKKIFPNPAQNVLHITRADNQTYRIYSITGSIVQEGIVSNGKIDISNLLKGNYLLQIQNNTSIKFIKE